MFNLLTRDQPWGHYFQQLFLLTRCSGQDELRKKTAEWETREAEYKTTVETAAAAHTTTLAEIQGKLEELTKSNQELLGQREELEKQLDGMWNYLKPGYIIVVSLPLISTLVK